MVPVGIYHRRSLHLRADSSAAHTVELEFHLPTCYNVHPILDVLDNYAFVRTSGYLAGTDDVYVSLTMVRKYGLRRGDAVTGQVRQPREGERKEKFNPMVKIESVNGQEPDASRHRPDFARLTPLYPSERLRLETGPTDLVGRVVDLLDTGPQSVLRCEYTGADGKPAERLIPFVSAYIQSVSLADKLIVADWGLDY